MNRSFRPTSVRIRTVCGLCAALSTLLILSGVAALADTERAQVLARGDDSTIAAPTSPGAVATRPA